MKNSLKTPCFTSEWHNSRCAIREISALRNSNLWFWILIRIARVSIILFFFSFSIWIKWIFRCVSCVNCNCWYVFVFFVSIPFHSECLSRIFPRRSEKKINQRNFISIDSLNREFTMIALNKIKIQLIGTLICLVVITLASIVTGQQAQPYQYPSPYQNAFNYDRRAYSPYSGFRAASLSPNNGESVRFPDAHLSPMSSAHGINNQNAFIGRHKKDMSRNDRSSEVSELMQHRLFF